MQLKKNECKLVTNPNLQLLLLLCLDIHQEQTEWVFGKPQKTLGALPSTALNKDELYVLKQETTRNLEREFLRGI